MIIVPLVATEGSFAQALGNLQPCSPDKGSSIGR